MHKYVGTYRLKAEIDQQTNDFCRNDKGELENNQDIYIKCAKDVRIYHYDGSTLLAYIPSKGRGRNIVKNENIKDFIFDIEETDSEVLFKFKDKHMKEIASVLQPQVSGASISPFSSKNLPKKKYNYTEKQKNEYENIIKSIPKNKLLSLHSIMKDFVKNVIVKYTGLSYENIQIDMKKKKLSIKDYIYELGFGEEFIIFLKKEVKKYK